MRFAKAAEQNYSTEIFKVANVIERRPCEFYELEDLNGTPIDGQFYRVELSPVRINDRTAYKIDKCWTKMSEEAFLNIPSAGEFSVRTSNLGYLQLA